MTYTASAGGKPDQDHGYPDGVRPVSGLYKWTRILLILSIATSILLSIASAAASFTPELMDEYAAGPMSEGAMALSLALLAISVVYLMLFIACIVFIARITYRAMKNLHTVGEPIAEMSPGWAVGWYFIPIANLFKPFQGMSQIFHGSRHSAGEPAVDSSPLGLWWGTWIAGNFAGNVSFGLMDEIELSVGFDVLSTLLMVISTAALLSILKQVHDTQATLALGGQAGVFA